MKTKNKLLALLEIAIVLCSLFLVALPAIAAEQTTQEVSANTITTASEDDYVLGIYGNANEDDTIDMRDLTYVKLIFFGKKPETELADAKYDGKINPLDFIQIKLITVGKEKEITVVDEGDRIVTVKKPIKKIILSTFSGGEAIKTLKAEESVVGVGKGIARRKTFFPKLSELPLISGGHYDLYYEEIYELDPDILIIYAPSEKYAAQFGDILDKLEPRTTVLCLASTKIAFLTENMEKLGYILDKREEAEEFIDFYECIMNTIEERVEGISEKDKPRVFFECYKDYKTYDVYFDHIARAGCINIAADLGTGYLDVDPEWVIVQDPEIIVHLTSSTKCACGYDEDDATEMKAFRDVIMNRPELAKVTVVKTGRVYVIGNDIFSGAHHFIGIGYMAKWFHPEFFEDLDPKAIHQEYLTRFMRLDYDLDEHGVFVYPPLE